MKKAIVTGHSSGIGKACMELFLSKGYMVVGASRNILPGLKKVVQYEIDLASRAKREEFLLYISKHMPDINILVNNAGIMPFDESYPHAYERIMSVNLEAPYHLTTRLIETGVLLKGSCIINIASVSGMKGEADLPVYAMTKAGVISMTKSLARNWADRGIRVNSVSPGFINNTALAPGDTPPFLIETIPLKREGEPKEVAELVWSIAKCSYVTGANYVVDGGMTA